MVNLADRLPVRRNPVHVLSDFRRIVHDGPLHIRVRKRPTVSFGWRYAFSGGPIKNARHARIFPLKFQTNGEIRTNELGNQQIL
jgi:hypothetical protein